MMWLIVAGVVVVFIAGMVFLDRLDTSENTISTDMLVRLYVIRKRFEVSQYKLGVRRDFARAQRELREELRKRL